MLPDQFRINIKNSTTVSIDASKITIKYRGKYFDSNGKLNLEAESADVANQSGSIADGAFNAGSTIDNGAKTNPLVEADLHIDVNLSSNTATPAGDVHFYLQRATADSPGWPTNGEGDEWIGSLNFSSKTDKDLTLTIA